MFRRSLRHPQGELFITFQTLLEKVLKSDKRGWRSERRNM